MFVLNKNKHITSVSLQRVFSTKLLAALSLALSLLVLATSALASKGGELADKARVVTVSASELKVIENTNFALYSLSAVREGRLVPIPHQFEEYTESGFVYLPNMPEKEKKENPLVGKPDIFDSKDELLFMLKDAGPRKSKDMISDGKLIAEIEVTDYQGNKKYVYLVEGARFQAEDYYVRFSAQLGRVETDYYALKVDPANAFVWQEFQYESYTGRYTKKPIDTLKLRMSSNILAAVPLTMTNKNMIARVVDEKSGPIRSTTEYKVTLTYLKAPIMSFDLQILHHEQDFTYDSKVTVPAVRRRFVSKASMMVSMDGNDLRGAEVRTSKGPKTPAIVDGAISPLEQEMIDAVFLEDEINWYFINTDEGFSALVNFTVEGDEHMPMVVVYEEEPERELKPEHNKGQMPNVGFGLARTPMKGDMRIITYTHMFNQAIDIDATEFADHVIRKPKIVVNTL